LEIRGVVGKPFSLSLDELKDRPKVSLACTLECAGNGRARLSPRPLSQPWLEEAVGNAEWTGTPLAPLLDEAGVQDGAVEVLFAGLDRGIQGEVEHAYERSLPLDEALRPEVLLAYEVNGQPLPPQHGYPLRLIVPGWYGMTHVKWLERITVLDESFDGYQQAEQYREKQSEDDPGVAITRMLPRSLLIPPGIPDFPDRRRFLEPGPATGPSRGSRSASTVARAGRTRHSTTRSASSAGAAGRSAGTTSRPASTSSARGRPTLRATSSRPSRAGTTAATSTTPCSVSP
jgi:DMSO/TMAO reductase YedYZ molybdopterin-dependent catalytic subunit